MLQNSSSLRTEDSYFKVPTGITVISEVGFKLMLMSLWLWEAKESSFILDV